MFFCLKIALIINKVIFTNICYTILKEVRNMLKKFEVEGFKSFENKFTLDLSKSNDSDYNREIVDNSRI